MTAQEFGEWQVFLQREELHPAADRLRHAQMLSATLNGPVTRQSGGMFSAAELQPPNPWEAPATRAEPTAADIAAQVRAINSRFDA